MMPGSDQPRHIKYRAECGCFERVIGVLLWGMRNVRYEDAVGDQPAAPVVAAEQAEVLDQPKVAAAAA